MKFRRQSRLTQSSQFQRVFRQSQTSGDAYFRVLARANELGHSRLGLAVSKRVARSAVVRNRLKRVVRESFRSHQHILAGDASLDLVVLPSPRAAAMSSSKLTASLHAHWQKLAGRQVSNRHQRHR